ncbi:spore germination protein [Paenibacillus hexagrammi]|uniref:Spore germination protein n=1 Tax=Paenibacillus hexagrammi TaxID=2908839 RepID=A0ABY3SLU6_9BACL|nr:spore germination protein [Paenibacillus sp. YPD9-1]UJF34051.1 spore germination protein [Paenibacillus sp. YPD9-1]
MSNDNLIVNRIKMNLSSSADLNVQHVDNGSFEMDVLFLGSMIEAQQIQSFVSTPLLRSDSFERFKTAFLAFGAESIEDVSEIVPRMLNGYVIVVYYSEVYGLPIKKALNDSPEATQTENTVLGPNKSFTENIMVNMAIVRSRYFRKELSSQEFDIGSVTKTSVMMMYDASFANEELLNKVRRRLSEIEVDVLQSAGQLEKLINKQKYSLFPTMMITERPDRVVLNLAHGKIVLFIQGTPFALILPAVFFDFMAAMDDLYQSFWISRALVVLRYIGLFITILLPAIYVSIVSYNPEFFRVQLTLSISGSRAAVPYPSYVEVAIMLFMIEALMEASLRLPKFIGSTATTVGGLILGQAAQQAGLVSSIMIIITSAVAISNFVIPINSMSFAMRFVKYILILLASFFGLIGTMAGLFMLIGYLASLRSFGEPYLKLFIGERNVSFPKSEGDTD